MQPRFQVIRTRQAAAAPRIRDAWSRAALRQRAHMAYYQSPAYYDHLVAQGQGDALALAVAHDGEGAPLGVSPLRSGSLDLDFAVRDVRVARASFPSVRLLGGLGLPETEPESVVAFVRTLSDAYPNAAAFEIRALPVESALWEQLCTRPPMPDEFMLYAPHGARPCHMLSLAPSYDEYLGRFSRKKRYNLKRQVRRLDEMTGGALRLERIDTPESAATLAEAFGTLRPDAARRDGSQRLDGGQLADLAARGLLLSYVMFGRDRPIAAALGTRFGDALLMHRFAHDRDLDSWSPGIVLQVLMAKDLIETKLARRIDYGFGEPSFRLINEVEPRVTAVLVRRDLLRRMTIAAHASFTWLALQAKRLARSGRRPRPDAD